MQMMDTAPARNTATAALPPKQAPRGPMGPLGKEPQAKSEHGASKPIEGFSGPGVKGGKV